MEGNQDWVLGAIPRRVALSTRDIIEYSHILTEWKMDLDSQTDTHRHLSHLIGLYPGYALTGYTDAAPIANYTRKEVLDAVTVSLIARGNGTGPDADSGENSPSIFDESNTHLLWM